MSEHEIGNPCDPGSCICWPCPNPKTCFPCASQWTREDFEEWLPIANQMAFEDMGRRWPGCNCFARLRICKPCGCSCACSCKPDMLDLWPTLKYPALEIVDVEREGVWQGDGEGFEIWEHRNLRACEGWPQQTMSAKTGAPCTWSIVVRFGAQPHPLAVKARDEQLVRLLLDNCGAPRKGCKIDGNIVSLSENGRTMQFDLTRPSGLYSSAVRRFNTTRSRERGSMRDPAQASHRGNGGGYVVAVPLDDWEPPEGTQTCESIEECLDEIFDEDGMLEVADREPRGGVVDPITGQLVDG